MRAKNITDRICHDFCEWLRDLGGTDKVIDEEVLGDMFEIDFTAEASRTMKVDRNKVRNERESLRNFAVLAKQSYCSIVM